MSAARGLLVTGTDTGVGKTFVAAALTAALSSRIRVTVLKPAETGCPELGGDLHPLDALRLREAAGSKDPIDRICPYRYAEPLAPWIAAERAGRPIDPAEIRRRYAELASRSDLVVVESAGGLLVPLTRHYSFADLAGDLHLPILLVVGSRLGALNQTLLTIECLRGRGLELRGYVLNRTTPETDLAQATNEAALEGLTDAERLAVFPHVSRAAELTRSELAAIGGPLAERLSRAGAAGGEASG